MPEMPEVENMALGLRTVIVGKRIAGVRVETPGMIRGPYRRRWRRFLGELADRRIERVARRAKRLILAAEGDLALVFQLGMTGKFLLPGGDMAGGSAQRHKHTRLVMAFGDGSELHFVDMRRFGRLWCLRDLDPDDPDAILEAAGMTPLGPEALSMGRWAFE